jgi:hypothetical protein
MTVESNEKINEAKLKQEKELKEKEFKIKKEIELIKIKNKPKKIG